MEKLGEEVSLSLREYQLELALPALHGKNVIVCAPTGSGKTYVAVYIAMQNLLRNADYKVAFIVDKVTLVEQQSALFRRFFKNKVSDISGGISSQNSDIIPVKRVVQSSNIVILTAQIFLNALEELNPADILQISQFNLIFFDECHHCDKEHPYNKIMKYYFNARNNKLDLPQIIGLTASPGTGKADKIDKAICHIFKLCANLDCEQLCVTDKNINDLTKYQILPSDKILQIGLREKDFLILLIHKLMDYCEENLYPILKSLQSLERIDKEDRYCFISSDKRGSQQYTNFIGNTYNKLPLISDNELYKEAYACWCYLKYLNLGITLNWLFNSCDAVAYIYKMLLPSINNPDNNDEEDFENEYFIEIEPTCEVDQQLRIQLKKTFDNIDEKVGNPYFESSNPLLQHLKEIILQQLKEIEDSRIIIFVKERSYATAMKRFFNHDSDLKNIGTDKLVGANAAAASEGLTKLEQIDAIQLFKEGKYKVLIATSVAEEGLDIAKCNLVIRYATVTNEIAMVQSKGRGRAENSKYIVIVPKHEDWLAKKEKINIERDKMMHEAIQYICNMPDKEYQKKLKDIQLEHFLKREVEAAKMMKQRENISDNEFLLYCVKCRTFICDTTSLRLVHGMHHISLSEELLTESRILIKRESGTPVGRAGNYETMGKICCNNCNTNLGSLCRIEGIVYPNLAIKHFSLKSCIEDEFISPPPKKWKDAKMYFNVIELSSADKLDRVKGRLGAEFILESSSDEDSSVSD